MKTKLVVLLIGMALVLGMVSGCLEEEKDDDEEEKNKEPVIGEIYYTPTDNITVLEDITFNITATDENKDDALTYTWAFGDGNNSTDTKPVHNYSSPGDYTVTVTVSDGTVEKTAQTTVNVTAEDEIPSVNHQPVIGSEGIQITEGVDDGNYTVNELLTFSVNATDSDNDLLTYGWDFGDGNNSELSSQSSTLYNYSQNGTYTVTVTVSDGTEDVDAELEIEIKTET